MTLTLIFMPKTKIYSLGQLNTLQSCVTILAARLAATKTLIVRKALKVTKHTRITTPCQTSHNTKRPCGALQFFPYCFSYYSSLSNCL